MKEWPALIALVRPDVESCPALAGGHAATAWPLRERSLASHRCIAASARHGRQHSAIFAVSAGGVLSAC
jgi:hypothetical protein